MSDGHGSPVSSFAGVAAALERFAAANRPGAALSPGEFAAWRQTLAECRAFCRARLPPFPAVKVAAEIAGGAGGFAIGFADIAGALSAIGFFLGFVGSSVTVASLTEHLRERREAVELLERVGDAQQSLLDRVTPPAHAAPAAG